MAANLFAGAPRSLMEVNTRPSFRGAAREPGIQKRPVRKLLDSGFRLRRPRNDVMQKSMQNKGPADFSAGPENPQASNAISAFPDTC
jgi:hypothetical protein